MTLLSSIATEMNARLRGDDFSPFGCLFGDLPPVTRPCKATLVRRAELARLPAGEIISAQDAREQGYAI